MKQYEYQFRRYDGCSKDSVQEEVQEDMNKLGAAGYELVGWSHDAGVSGGWVYAAFKREILPDTRQESRERKLEPEL